MTLPLERTRSLMFGFEFLAELYMADNLMPEQRHTLDDILSAYPTPEEITRWAQYCMAQVDPLGICEPDLSLEGEHYQIRLPEGFTMWERPTIEPWKRAKALFVMDEFLRQLWRAKNLTDEQRRSIPFVQRHYLERWRLEAMAQRCEKRLQQDPTLKVWVLPQPRPASLVENNTTGGIHHE